MGAQKKNGQKCKNTKKLYETFVHEWNSISPEICQNLVKSMPKRIEKVINRYGYPCSYQNCTHFNIFLYLCNMSRLFCLHQYLQKINNCIITFLIFYFIKSSLYYSKEHKNLYQNMQIKYFKNW